MPPLRGTGRQLQILELAAQGQSDKEIAVALGISVHTVRSHLQRLYSSHGLSNRAEAVASWVAQEQAAVLQPEEEAAEFEEKLSAAAETAASARLLRGTRARAGTAVQTAEAPAQLELINRERDAAGLTQLEWSQALADLASIGARQMADQGHLSTVMGAVQGELAAAVNAENVGYWSGINDQQLHSLFVADSKQRANILGPHRMAGAAWATTASGVAFLSVVFA